MAYDTPIISLWRYKQLHILWFGDIGPASCQAQAAVTANGKSTDGIRIPVSRKQEMSVRRYAQTMGIPAAAADMLH